MEEQTNNVEKQEEIYNVTDTSQNQTTNSNEQIIDNQIIDTSEKIGNIPLAIVFGLVASLIGASLWAVITISTKYQIGYMAIAIGFLVGYAVRFGGKGHHITFGVIGAVFSLFGCVLGNYLSLIGFTSTEIHMSFFQTFTTVSPSLVFQVMTEQFQFMDIVLYGIAVYEGFKFSFLSH